MAEFKLGEGVRAVYDPSSGDIHVTVASEEQTGPRFEVVEPTLSGPLVSVTDGFTVSERRFTRSAPGSLTWVSTDGWRFWLGEEVKPGVWTMGADRGQSESVFAFGVFESTEECLAELEQLLLGAG